MYHILCGSYYRVDIINIKFFFSITHDMIYNTYFQVYGYLCIYIYI